VYNCLKCKRIVFCVVSNDDSKSVLLELSKNIW